MIALKNRIKITLATMLLALFSAACGQTNSSVNVANSFGLPEKIAANAKIIKKGKVIGMDISQDDYLYIKSSSSEFTKWYNLEPDTIIESNGFKIRGKEGQKIEYSIGQTSNGMIKVLVYNKTENFLYAIFADGIM